MTVLITRLVVQQPATPGLLIKHNFIVFFIFFNLELIKTVKKINSQSAIFVNIGPTITIFVYSLERQAFKVFSLLQWPDEQRHHPAHSQKQKTTNAKVILSLNWMCARFSVTSSEKSESIKYTTENCRKRRKTSLNNGYKTINIKTAPCNLEHFF